MSSKTIAILVLVIITIGLVWFVSMLSSQPKVGQNQQPVQAEQMEENQAPQETEQPQSVVPQNTVLQSQASLNEAVEPQIEPLVSITKDEPNIVGTYEPEFNAVLYIKSAGAYSLHFTGDDTWMYGKWTQEGIKLHLVSTADDPYFGIMDFEILPNGNLTEWGEIWKKIE